MDTALEQKSDSQTATNRKRRDEIEVWLRLPNVRHRLAEKLREKDVCEQEEKIEAPGGLEDAASTASERVTEGEPRTERVDRAPADQASPSRPRRSKRFAAGQSSWRDWSLLRAKVRGAGRQFTVIGLLLSLLIAAFMVLGKSGTDSDAPEATINSQEEDQNRQWQSPPDAPQASAVVDSAFDQLNATSLDGAVLAVPRLGMPEVARATPTAQADAAIASRPDSSGTIKSGRLPAANPHDTHDLSAVSPAKYPHTDPTSYRYPGEVDRRWQTAGREGQFGAQPGDQREPSVARLRGTIESPSYQRQR